MSTLLVLGAGGHGRVLADAAIESGNWHTVHFLDDRPEAEHVLGFPVVGRVADLERLRKSYSCAALGIGNVFARLQLLDRCAATGYELPVIRHPTAAISRFAHLGPGCVVFAQSAINAASSLGRGCIVNTGATIDHDCELEEGVHVCPGVHVAGNVRVGARTWIGIGSSVKHGVRIGADVTVGAGAAVVCNIDSGSTVIGVPARPRKSE